MARAFTNEKKKKSGALSMKFLVPILFFLLVVIVVLFGLQTVSGSSNKERLNTTEQAIRRSAVQCYAIEGQYPPDLQYLQDNYGLIVDKDTYVYHYQSNGTNIMPDIRVFTK